MAYLKAYNVSTQAVEEAAYRAVPEGEVLHCGSLQDMLHSLASMDRWYTDMVALSENLLCRYGGS